MALLTPAFAAGFGLTVTTTVFVVEQVPLDSVRLYVVVVVGDTDGLDTVDVNPVGVDVHEYVLPVTDAAPIVVELPVQMAFADPVVAAGTGFTVMTTVFVVEHVPLDSVRLYVVVTVGDTDGLETVEVNPLGLDVHE